MLSEFRKQKFTYYFNLWDADHKGYLDVNDYLILTNRIAKLWNLSQESHEYQELRDLTLSVWELDILPFADHDMDGKVMLADYLIFCEAFMPLMREAAQQHIVDPIARRVFLFMDANGDGAVEAADWHHFIEAWGFEADAATHFAQMDTNGDGHIILNELMALYYQFVLSDDPAEPGNYLFGKVE